MPIIWNDIHVRIAHYCIRNVSRKKSIRRNLSHSMHNLFHFYALNFHMSNALFIGAFIWCKYSLFNHNATSIRKAIIQCITAIINAMESIIYHFNLLELIAICCMLSADEWFANDWFRLGWWRIRRHLRRRIKLHIFKLVAYWS